MKPKILLRIASVLMLLHDIGHTMGHSGWKHVPDPAKQAVIDQMNGSKFPFMGASHSMGDYFEGYGYAASFALLFIAGVLWILSGATAATVTIARKILFLLTVALIGWGMVELIYFFPFAASFTLVSALMTAISAFSLRETA